VIIRERDEHEEVSKGGRRWRCVRLKSNPDTDNNHKIAERQDCRVFR
jgi:hypothetical protein